MAVEEAIESQIRNIAVSGAKSGAHLFVKISASLAKLLARSTGTLISALSQTTKNLVSEKVNSGKMSERRLQKTTGADLHELKLDTQSMKDVTKSLKKAGVNYAIEKNGADEFFLHFEGKDLDHVQHSVERAFEKTGLTFDPDSMTTREAPQKTTPPKKEKKSAPTKKNKHDFMAKLNEKTQEKLTAAKAADNLTKTKGKTR